MLASLTFPFVFLVIFILVLTRTSSLMKFLFPFMKMISAVIFLMIFSWGNSADTFPFVLAVLAGLWTVCFV
uniref:NADH dehydrogenase subunit 4L n=1 Tax=Kudoa septempunctata TaxID=751907 RepID=A0A0H5AY10_9CNID|nr:NADH dehydrogenase subunit 4L [Kudoa septempunctata]BAR94681.1 NADH dehydrogenase subunit 4L [Kudoa septempunctata]BAR94693.1 NADH dehydrogenase subunit 4L [Kudoa septempunctata]